MRIQTFSIVVGSPACNANCPFCISRITGYNELTRPEEINRINFRKAVKFAEKGNCTTVLFTGKGEPLLDTYLDEINNYLILLQKYGNPFPFIEIQTNGIRIGELAALRKLAAGTYPRGRLKKYLDNWRELGLNTIAVSCVGYKTEHNEQIYLNHREEKYPDLALTVEFLHDLGYTVRLCVMMHKGMVETPADIEEVITWCRENKVEQLTVRPIRVPAQEPTIENEEYFHYVRTHGLRTCDEERIQHWLRRMQLEGKAHHLMTLMHGANEAKIYDVGGQNLCYADCLTIEPVSDDIRTLIFFADGRLTYSWNHPGARLL